MVYFYVLGSKNILVKLVGYRKSTYLCVNMEFVVGIISLSFELYSLSWSCFRSPGSGTIVYGKWCFDLHVESCGSSMISTIGVGARKFRGCEGFMPKFSKLARKVLGDFSCKLFPSKMIKIFFGMTSKKGVDVFFCKHWAPFYEVKQDWAPFFPDFQSFFPDFQGFCPDFHKIKTFRVRLHPASYTTG